MIPNMSDGTRGQSAWNLLRTWRTLVFGALSLVLFSHEALAGNFQVNPVQIFLSKDAPTSLVSVRNESDEQMRFQITGFTWQQDEKGEMKLAPTQDIVFFPALLVLNKAEKRNIRVGTSVEAGTQEKTYRIFVEELPPLVKQNDKKNAVRVLTRMGIPIFITPQGAKASADIQGPSVRNGRIAFKVRNMGNAHFRLTGIRVGLKDVAGKALSERTEPGWYVLAGGVRAYDLELAADACKQAKVVEIDLQSDVVKGHTAVPVTPGDCSP